MTAPSSLTARGATLWAELEFQETEQREEKAERERRRLEGICIYGARNLSSSRSIEDEEEEEAIDCFFVLLLHFVCFKRALECSRADTIVADLLHSDADAAAESLMPLAVRVGSLHAVKLLEASGCGIDEMVLCEAMVTLLECSDVKGARDKEKRTTFSVAEERHVHSQVQRLLVNLLQWGDALMRVARVDDVVKDEGKGRTMVLVAPNVFSLEHVIERLELVYPMVEKVRIDLETGILKRQPLSARNLDFRVLNPAYVGKKNRFVYAAMGDPMPKISGVVKLDVFKGEGEVGRRFYGEGCYGGEPLFVTREDVVEEDNDYLVTYVHDERTIRNHNNSPSLIFFFPARCDLAAPPALSRLCHVPSLHPFSLSSFSSLSTSPLLPPPAVVASGLVALASVGSRCCTPDLNSLPLLSTHAPNPIPLFSSSFVVHRV
ncbi:hypothetical protein Fmac_018377 [Flemingia macrophylla]|uniref:Uncharacterized protein n=1 Tax=Flemingia macrophylla TaxID=520843 RepID=A0ABD1M4X8_9FABA